MIFIFSYSVIPLFQAFVPERYADYNIFLIPFVENCDITQYPKRDGITLNSDNVTATHDGIYQPTRDPLKWWFNCLSYNLTGTPKLIPVLFNIGLMPLVYLLTITITKDRFVSFIALIAFSYNPLYSNWIGSGLYDQIWSFFLVLSVLMIFKIKDQDISTIPLLLSISAKTLTLMYFPSWIFTILNSGKSKKQILKLFLFTTLLFILVFVFLYFHQDDLFGGSIGFHPERLHEAIWGNWEMLWLEIPFLLIFTLLSVNFIPINPSPNRKLCAIWILNSLITTPIIFLFTNQIQFVYRFVPLAVFMSIFIAITIKDSITFFIENRKYRLPKSK